VVKREEERVIVAASPIQAGVSDQVSTDGVQSLTEPKVTLTEARNGDVRKGRAT
jgi:hypothetical protein